MSFRNCIREPKAGGRRRTAAAILLLAVVAFSANAVRAQTASMRPSIFENVRLDQRLNEQIPLDLEFRDDTGKAVRLADYFGSKPVILTLVYYQCPMLCTQILNATTRGLQGVPMDIGKDFNVVTLSINPRETSADASNKKHIYTGIYGRPLAKEGWHFLTGDEPAIQAVADAAGFHYAFDKETGEYAHPSGIMVLTPEGRLSRYFYGVQFPSRDLRLALVESSSGKIGSPVDQLLLYCFHYDPQTGKYGLAISRVLKAAGLITMLGIAGMVLLLNRSDQKKRKVHVD